MNIIAYSTLVSNMSGQIISRQIMVVIFYCYIAAVAFLELAMTVWSIGLLVRHGDTRVELNDSLNDAFNNTNSSMDCNNTTRISINELPGGIMFAVRITTCIFTPIVFPATMILIATATAYYHTEKQSTIISGFMCTSFMVIYVPFCLSIYMMHVYNTLSSDEVAIWSDVNRGFINYFKNGGRMIFGFTFTYIVISSILAFQPCKYRFPTFYEEEEGINVCICC